MYAFTNHSTSVGALKGVKLVQTNLVTLSRDTAFNWYDLELLEVIKWALNSNALLDRRSFRTGSAIGGLQLH